MIIRKWGEAQIPLPPLSCVRFEAFVWVMVNIIDFWMCYQVVWYIGEIFRRNFFAFICHEDGSSRFL